jgi:hypothetical protein
MKLFEVRTEVLGTGTEVCGLESGHYDRAELRNSGEL